MVQTAKLHLQNDVADLEKLVYTVQLVRYDVTIPIFCYEVITYDIFDTYNIFFLTACFLQGRVHI